MELMTIEIKSDLESVYKTLGDLLNDVEAMDFSHESERMKKLKEHVKFQLMDVEGTLQKDIYHCDYLMSKMKIIKETTKNHSKEME